MKFFNIKNILVACAFLLISNISVFATESASVQFSFNVDKYMQIQTVSSPVLMANITDRTGNLYSPLYSKFRVISNSHEEQELFLQAQAMTQAGNENAMFMMNGRTYIAFTNVKNSPKSQSFANCKIGLGPEESPGVVAYPVSSILGVKAQYQHGKNNYKILVKNGKTDITVNIGSQVLPNSFGKNDPNGFYQATLMLTEADI